MAQNGQMTGESDRQLFFSSVPWSDIILGFAVPKIIFYVSMDKPWVWAGGLIACLWCSVLLAYQYLSQRKINIFAILAFVMILIQMVPVVIKNDPIQNFKWGAFDCVLYGSLFLVSIIVRKPLMQIFAERTGIREKLPSYVIKSPHYVKAWFIISAVWAFIYIAEGIILYILADIRSPALVPFDILSSWPTLLTLIYFSIIFPRWYWGKFISITEHV